MSRRPWSALLVGPIQQRALETAERIGTALEALAPGIADPSVISGQCGFALFFQVLAQVAGKAAYAQVADRCLDRAIDALATEALAPGFDRGISGIAWTAQHLRAEANARAEDDACGEIDDVLLAYVSHTPWPHGFDLSEGLVGVGLYALERMPRLKARAVLEQVFLRLSELAVRSPDGVAWRTPVEHLPPSFRAGAPGGTYNLGVPHGGPGVLAFLAGLRRWEVGGPAAKALLEESMRWHGALLARLQKAGSLPDWLAEGRPVKLTRLYGWCYGAPNLAGSLLLAAEAEGREDWRAEAQRLAHASLGGPAEEAGVEDGCLCHGAAGLGHQFNRMGQRLGDAALLGEARRWFTRLFELETPGQGVAGFTQQVASAQGSLKPRATAGVAGGAAGIGLALLSAASALEPAWDRTFLLSFPEPTFHAASR